MSEQRVAAVTERLTAIWTLVHDDEDGELWMELTHLLTGADPTDYEPIYDGQAESDPDVRLMRLFVECDGPEVTALRLAAEICPVHECDAAICRDDDVGDGLLTCGQETCAQCGGSGTDAAGISDAPCDVCGGSGIAPREAS